MFEKLHAHRQARAATPRCLRLLPLLVLAAALLAAVPRAAPAFSGFDFEANRARLLGLLVRTQLESHHFSHKRIDDELSRHAFALYLKTLDFQKRFLLQDDVTRLRAFETDIDQELAGRSMPLVDLSASLMKARVKEVREMVRGLLAADFPLSSRETLETDPEKLDFCRSRKELNQRWRRILHYQVALRYLDLLDMARTEAGAPGAKDAAPPAEDPALRAKAREKVRAAYEQFFDRLLKEKERDYYDRLFDAVARAFDPHTNYLAPLQKEDFDISMKGSLEGIGALLREEDGYVKVVRVIPGGAAYRQGELEPEDAILKVGEAGAEPVEITGMRLRDAVELIRGRKGSEVRLTVRKPDGTIKVIPIVRDVVQIEETFVKDMVLGPADRPVGYLRIPSFYRDFQAINNGGKGRSSTDDVRKALKALEARHIRGLVLDIRNNGGGSLVDAVDITGLFIPSGPVVQVKNSDGSVQVLADDDPAVVYDGPVVVLVNQFSASASEILAAALQDYGRAVIMGGEHTHGKGTVQAMVDMDYMVRNGRFAKYKPLGALMITIQKFYRVTGETTQFKGVVPDIVLPDRLNALKTGERYLDFALPWDTVPPVAFTPWPGPIRGRLAAVKAASARRVATDPAFAEIRRAMEESAQRQADTRRSLDLAAIRAALASDRARSRTAPHQAAPFDDALPPPEADDNATGPDAWRKAVREDPVVREAIQVLADLGGPASARKAPSAAGSLLPAREQAPRHHHVPAVALPQPVQGPVERLP
ncbi:tail-specific protease [Dissulfurirhabdus thermomarina]|uniref:Tail-specific protease n=1 Tax=Dissulfurirhabdus thermomarina TaxID=1765737 RepID=A0A6N9TNH8_DISTH|nr:carboxy terminal-processing peptidase [Dissulfurirhabdus thermomarina]NDY41643.1 tail-specific protease [Dissulfurirhabdus thermomarina]NMX24335.1 carboxy terminal-processing peptidase [Dissulfurirhabdus thermomarina]